MQQQKQQQVKQFSIQSSKSTCFAVEGVVGRLVTLVVFVFLVSSEEVRSNTCCSGALVCSISISAVLQDDGSVAGSSLMVIRSEKKTVSRQPSYATLWAMSKSIRTNNMHSD
jgi:hypothetical protein